MGVWCSCTWSDNASNVEIRNECQIDGGQKEARPFPLNDDSSTLQITSDRYEARDSQGVTSHPTTVESHKSHRTTVDSSTVGSKISSRLTSTKSHRTTTLESIDSLRADPALAAHVTRLLDDVCARDSAKLTMEIICSGGGSYTFVDEAIDVALRHRDVRIESVPIGGAAADKGMKAGMVIESIGGEDMTKLEREVANRVAIRHIQDHNAALGFAVVLTSREGMTPKNSRKIE